MANPCYTQIHPTCIPVTGHHQSKLTLMSESLRNDGRIWVPKKQADCAKDPREIAEEDRDYYLERIYPAFGNLVPRDIASRQAKNMCDEGRGVGPEVEGVRRGVYLDFAEAIERLGRETIEEKWCSPPAATATSSSSRPTRWAATSPPPGARTARAPTWPTPATRRSTRPASRSSGDAPVEADPDERVAAQRRPDLGAEEGRGLRQGPAEIAEQDRDYYLERIYPAFGNLVPRDIASRQAKNMCDDGRGVGPEVDGVRRGVYLDFTDAMNRLGRQAIEDKYGNLFDMYAQITGEDPYQVPMRIYPAVTM